ncbi:hypothetical protein XFLAVUS301_31820 [Xanthobacter flavus]|uniref:Uncharacterized protein n=2 Tax=Xanthobacter flavus TaxID=281 RepID=A0A9W6FN11_XANFL|nr:hypothetical protein XFLAVUS301_31820 [Xanthobacter flavus]
MAPKPPPPPPMDLANMRQNGVRYVTAFCIDCHHEANVLADRWGDEETVPGLARHFRCSECGSRKVQVRPAWHLRS